MNWFTDVAWDWPPRRDSVSICNEILPAEQQAEIEFAARLAVSHPREAERHRHFAGYSGL